MMGTSVTTAQACSRQASPTQGKTASKRTYFGGDLLLQNQSETATSNKDGCPTGGEVLKHSQSLLPRLLQEESPWEQSFMICATAALCMCVCARVHACMLFKGMMYFSILKIRHPLHITSDMAALIQCWISPLPSTRYRLELLRCLSILHEHELASLF